MESKMKTTLIMMMFAGIFLTACSEDDVLNYDFDTVEEAILSIIAGTDSLERLDGLDDGGAVDIGSYSSGGLGKVAADTFSPIKIGRRIDSTSFERTVEILGDSVAIVTSTATITGDFIIIAFISLDTTVIDTFVKPFNMEMTRKIKLIRVGTGEARRLNWRIVGVTPVIGGTIASTIEFLEFAMISESGDSLVITDPLNTFINWRELPEFEPGDTVTVLLTLTNSSSFDAEMVLMHHGARSRIDKGRKRLFDDGTHSDEVADDNVYTGTFLSRATRGRMRNGFIDAIDWGTIFDPTGEVNTKVMGLPYMIRRMP